MDGLPEVVQVVGPHYCEELRLDAAAAIEDRLGVFTPIDPRRPGALRHGEGVAMSASSDEAKLRGGVSEVLSKWPVVGLAAGVIKDGSLAWFHGHGVADIESRTPIEHDTVFRIASVTKTMTAIAVMQLKEQGEVDLARSERLRPRLATGYQIRSRGATAVRDFEIVHAGAGAVYSTTGDMARYVAALLGGGANACGAVLKAQTIAEMFRPQYQPDPRIPGMGLGFFRGLAGGYRTVGHDGIWLGFHSAVVLVPDEGIGVVALTNTGPFSPFAAAGPLANAVLRSLLGLPEDVPATDVPERPWVWDELCGSYTFGPGILTDPQPRMLGPAVEVAARRDHLVVRGQLPVPAVRKGLRLYPDTDDPDVFRVRMPGFGSGTSLVVFSRDSGGKVTGMHLGMQPMSLRKRLRSMRRPGDRAK